MLSIRVAVVSSMLLFGPSVHAESDPKPQLMVLGAVHFANPGLDKVNLKVEDVLKPDRQIELDRLVESLARFRPSHIAVEWDASAQGELDKAYAVWRSGDRSNRDERHQIAFRMAEKLGLARVHAVDWQRPPPGDQKLYDFPAWAREHGQSAPLDAVFAGLQAESDDLQRRMPCLTVSGWLAHANSPAAQRQNALAYYPIARVGDNQVAPGASWVGGSWHARNLRIWANLAALGSKPKDRVLLVVGSGHRPLIEHFSRDSDSFVVVDPLKWLPREKARRGETCPPK